MQRQAWKFRLKEVCGTHLTLVHLNCKILPTKITPNALQIWNEYMHVCMQGFNVRSVFRCNQPVFVTIILLCNASAIMIRTKNELNILDIARIIRRPTRTSMSPTTSQMAWWTLSLTVFFCPKSIANFPHQRGQLGRQFREDIGAIAGQNLGGGAAVLWIPAHRLDRWGIPHGTSWDRGKILGPQHCAQFNDDHHKLPVGCVGRKF